MRMKRKIKFHYISILLVLFLFGCSANQSESTNVENNVTENQENNSEVEIVDEPIEEPDPEPEPIVEEITVSAIGDMLIHSRVYNDAKSGNGYNFMPMLTEIEKYLQETTISFANQETMIGGVEHGLSTYPAFNSPTEVGDALKEIGISIVSLANNHTLDRGEAVIQSAIKHWEKIDMHYVGSYKDEEDQQRIRVVKTDEGIDVAFLAYTYGTNGIPIPEGKEYLVNLIDRDKISANIKEAKELADVVIVSLHFGNEYEMMPSEEQKELVQFVADEGAHAVLGHHPHVLQPVEWVQGSNEHPLLVVYSLGNFLSGQEEFERKTGGILQFSIEKVTDVAADEVEIKVHSPRFLITYNASNGNTNYRVLPMFSAPESVLTNRASRYEEMKAHMAQWIPELEFIEE